MSALPCTCGYSAQQTVSSSEGNNGEMSASGEKNRFIVSGQYWRYSYYYPRAFSPQATDPGHRHYLFYYLLGFLWGKVFKDIKLQPIKTLEEKTLYDETPEDFSARAFMCWSLSLWMNFWQHVQEAGMPPEHLLCCARCHSRYRYTEERIGRAQWTSRNSLQGEQDNGFFPFSMYFVILASNRPFYNVLSGARRRMLLFWPRSGRSVRLSWAWGQLLNWQNDKDDFFFFFAYLAAALCNKSHHVELHSSP